MTQCNSCCFQKLSDADKLYSTAYMSDPRLCHTSALRLGTPAPDNKNGKEDKSERQDKLIPVKEEDGVEVVGGVQSAEADYGVTGDWCEPGDLVSQSYSPGDQATTVCSVFSLSECVVTGPPGDPGVTPSSVSVSPAVSALPVTEVRLL